MKATYRVFDASASYVKGKLGDLFFIWVKIGRRALHGGTPILIEGRFSGRPTILSKAVSNNQIFKYLIET